MYDVTRRELIAAAEAEGRAWLHTDDIHPYKSRVPRAEGNTVLFPKITKFSTYLLRHYGAEIVDEINSMMYDGELTAVCGVDGFYSQRLTHDKCRIAPRMSFWRIDKYDFIAVIVVHLTARTYTDDASSVEDFTLYVELDFTLDERMSYSIENVSLRPPERDLIKLDDYLIPILNHQDINKATEAQWFKYIPEALVDHHYLNPYRLADKMGLTVAHRRLYKNPKTRSILFWADSEVKVIPKDGDEKSPPEVITIPAGTILVNTSIIDSDQTRLSVFHECFHDEYHWLFFRLQEMHNNDLRKIKKTRKPKNQGKEPTNPLTILEWEAKQGSRALMMPECMIRPMIEELKAEEQKVWHHAGNVLQAVCFSIHDKIGVPKYLIRGRMIQLGYWQAQGAANYIRKNETSGRYIEPFLFSKEGCPNTSHTFVINPDEAFKLYEQNEEFRARIDTGDYVYVEGHFCLNDPAYVIQTSHGPHMTDWANRHIDECCLRFENVYVVDERYEFHLESINSDEEYNRHYIDFVAQGRELTPKEAAEHQTRVIESLPEKPGEALKELMRLSGNVTVEQLAERAGVSEGTVKNWRKEEYVYDAETALRIIVALHLPPWISMWLLQISGVSLQYRGKHMMYRNIIACHYMDTLNEVNDLLEAAGFERLKMV